MSYVPANPGSYDPHILSLEYFWVDHQPFLMSRGYRLRPRYDPKWVPSWKRAEGGKKILPLMCEDGRGMLVSPIFSLTLS
ncbi:hypothetical protein PILCRDRAFT_255341 [Piloderma croceum F 1598]|uniref:Uncharacterized protein n=1 Tax=Piloderma croceum (strain F 1598) TaxID=765440 RepID=A0A0C3GCK7_PILCF|nr:hypothetical protein PILCRDRAFT_255341 [Piloderma croceum F 1598]